VGAKGGQKIVCSVQSGVATGCKQTCVMVRISDQFIQFDQGDILHEVDRGPCGATYTEEKRKYRMLLVMRVSLVILASEALITPS
jgi:hypothetical protein